MRTQKKKRVHARKLQKRLRIANIYKKDQKRSSRKLDCDMKVDVPASSTHPFCSDQVLAELEMQSANERIHMAALDNNEQSTSKRSLLLRQAAERKKLQLYIKTLKERRKKMKASNKEQKKQLSRKIKELTANLRSRQRQQLEEAEEVRGSGDGGQLTNEGFSMDQSMDAEEGTRDIDEWVYVPKGRKKSINAREASRRTPTSMPPTGQGFSNTMEQSTEERHLIHDSDDEIEKVEHQCDTY